MSSDLERPTRRRFLWTGAGLVLAAAWVGGRGFLASGARAAAPGAKQKIRDVEVTKRGVTVVMDLETAPFPHKSAGYKDPTVIAYIPAHFRVKKDMRIDTVVHFHGYRDTALEAMKRHQLREQLYDSKQNAIMVFPQGPVKSEDMAGGKLDEQDGLVNLLTEVRETLQSPSLQGRLDKSGIPGKARIGKCMLSAHSGGFRVVSYCLEHGGFNVNEVYLFDALYGRTDIFRDWITATYEKQAPMAERHKLVSFYSGVQPTTENKRLMWFLDKAKVEYMHEQIEGSELSKRDITKARAVFIRTQSAHDRVLFSTNAMRDCLYASCLERMLKSDWFKDADAPRIGPR
ncbi:MAG: hypothetical protein JNJ59_21420 [Deltaproteobacteria bacterium]|nr:hypothetical protein [Deltaproteobacteria bacterium]